MAGKTSTAMIASKANNLIFDIAFFLSWFRRVTLFFTSLKIRLYVLLFFAG